MALDQLNVLGSILGPLAQSRRLISAYVRARSAPTAPWVHTLIPFGTPVGPVPAPIYFEPPSVGLDTRNATDEVTISLDPAGLAAGRLTVRIEVTIAPAHRTAGHRVDVVLAPGESVLGAPAAGAPPLSLVALSLGRNPESLAAMDLPGSLVVTAQLATTTTGREDPVSVTVADSAGKGLVAWLVDGPRKQEAGWFGTRVGVGAVTNEVVNALRGIGLSLPLPGLLPPLGSDPAVKLQVVQVLTTVDLDAATSGVRVGVTHGTGTPSTVAATVTTSWTPPGGKPVTATVTSPGTGTAQPRRYLAAAKRQSDGAESPPGARSAVVQAGTSGSVKLVAPPAPDMGAEQFVGWVLYRSTQVNGAWGTPQLLDALRLDPKDPDPRRVRTVAAGEIITDTTPAADAPSALPPPAPGTLGVKWGADGGHPAPGPANAPLAVVTSALDETVPNPVTPVSVLTLRLDTFPASGTARYRGGRDRFAPLLVKWAAAETALAVGLVESRPSTDIRLGIRLPATLTANAIIQDRGPLTTWINANGPTLVTGYAHVPAAQFAVDEAWVVLPPKVSAALRLPDQRDREPAPDGRPLPVTAIGLGWRSDGANGSARGRVTTTPVGAPAASTEVTVPTLPPDLACRFLVGRAATGGKADPQSPVDIRLGPWSNPPAPGAAPDTENYPAIVDAPLVPALADLLVRHGPARTGGLDGAGPSDGPRLLADVDLREAVATRAAVRALGTKQFVLARPAGPTTTFNTTLELDRESALRMRLRSGPSGRTSDVRARVIRVPGPLHLALGLASVPASDRQQAEGTDDPLDVTVMRGADPHAVEGFRLAIDTQNPSGSGRLVAELDRLAPNASVRIMGAPMPALPPAAGFDWGGGGLRMRASLPGGARLRLTGCSTNELGTSPLSADVALPETTDLRIGPIGTLAGDSTKNRLVDPLAGWTADWVGRRITWQRGAGTITAVDGTDAVLVAPDAGANDPDMTRELVAWWRMGGVTPGADTDSGIRLVVPTGVVEGTVGVVTARLVNDQWRLRAPTAGPKVRIESRDDTARFTVPRIDAWGQKVTASDDTTDGRGQAVAVVARIAASNANLASWTVPDTDVRRVPPLTRLMAGGVSRPPTSFVFDEDPVRHSVTANDVFLVPGRANRSLSFIVHQRPTPPERGRDATHLRIVNTPDRATITTAPGALEIAADRAYGPGRFIAETAMWYRLAPRAEVFFTRAELAALPPMVQLVSGWREPELVDNLKDLDDFVTYGSVSVKNWRLGVLRITARGSPLRIGRMSSVTMDNPVDAGALWEPNRDNLWGLTDVWFLELYPNNGQQAALMLHSPGQTEKDGDSDVQVTCNSGQVKARVFKVSLGEHQFVGGRRSRLECEGWTKELGAEMQMDMVEGSFAVGPQVGWEPVRPLQDDETTDDSHWFVAAWKLPFGMPAQFGSDGGFGQFDAPWDPYWS